MENLGEIKKTVTFLGKPNEGKAEFNATGFLVSIQNIVHLITAKHVIVDKSGMFKDNNMVVFFNIKGGEIGGRQIEEIKKRFGVDWIFHENDEVDIAIIPLAVDLQRDDVRTIPENIFLDMNSSLELCDIFSLSFQPGILSPKRIMPIIRNGTISLVNEDGTFYIDAPAYPGNSGSPVFIKPSPIRFDAGSVQIGRDSIGGKFVGIIGEFLTYSEVAVSTQTLRPRIIFEENTGLSKVWSVRFLKGITESSAFKEQLEKIVGK